MRIALVENGIVVDTAVDDVIRAGWAICPDHIGIGMDINTPAPGLTAEDFTVAVQAHLDAVARAKNYDSILSCASYAASTNSTFSAEAVQAIAWRDAVWTYCYAQLADVQANSRSMPVSEAALIAELPSAPW